jgi:hypothetical protein
MRASELSFNEIAALSAGLPKLAILMSYIQVEYGIDDLRASWQGFSDSSDYYGNSYTDKRHICLKFGELLQEYIQFQQPISI